MEDCQQNRGATADLWPAFKRVVRGRRSIRSFQDKPVPRHLVAEMLEVARQAPSSGNTQPWHFYVVTDPEIRERLVASTFPGADCGSDRVQDWVRQAPVLIVVCLDWRRGATKYNFEHRYFLGLQDVGAAIENLLLSAEALGLGACWVGGIRF
ncbi:MAG TPA: hypothetical protein GX513_07835, partial [Firmicutes bacterium]|nr:hypothetical protein [Bacillota bacterium]